MSTPSLMPQVPAGSSIAARLPFAIDASGGVQVTADQGLQQLDRVQALVATLPGERVMRSTYGVPSTQVLFSPQEVSAAQIQLMVRNAAATWEPSAVITSVTSSVNANLGLVNVNVQVARNDTPGAEAANTRVVTVSPGGTVKPLGV